MRIEKIKNRSILFTNNTPWGWDVHMQLIMGDKYNYIIDTGLGSLNTLPIKDYLKDDNKQIMVINTHSHWDHIWGNRSLKDYTIISHKLCREMIESEWDETMEKYQKFVQGDAEMCLPSITFEKELYFPEDKIRFIYTPGHTIDSISVLDEVDKVIHVGDNIGDSMDELIPSLYCNKEVYRNTLLKYKELDFEVCISGHNKVLEKRIIDDLINML